MKIRTKLVLCFLLTTLLPVSFIATLSILQARSEAMQHFIDASSREIRQVDKTLSGAFQSVFNDVAFFAALPQMAQLGPEISNFSTLSGEQRMASAGKPGNEGELFRLFQQFGQNHPDLAYIYVGTEHGGIVQWPEGKVNAPYDPRKRGWYMQAMASPGRSVLTDAYYWPGDNATIVSAAHAIERDGRKFGVMAMDVSLKGLTELVRKIRIGESGFLMLVQGDGTVLVDPLKPEHNFKKLAEIDGGAYAALDAGQVAVTLGGEAYQANVIKSPLLGWKFIGLVKRAEIYAHAERMAWTIAAISLGLVLVLSLLGGWLAGLIARPVQQVAEGLHAIAAGDGELTRRLTVTSRDETATLAQRFNGILDTILHLVRQTSLKAGEVGESAGRVDHVARTMSQTAQAQLAVLENAASAVSRMADSAETVARNCEQAATAAQDGQQSVLQGEQVVDETVASVEALSATLRQASASLQELEAAGQDITAILEVIRGIADQTNLLALNAAIEAARAGEQGRGFAVVADEVRSLAQSTQQSTRQIQSLLDKLGQGTRLVAREMASSLAQSDDTVLKSGAAREAFGRISQSVRVIHEMNAQIARASTDQHQATARLSSDIEHVCGAAHQVSHHADEAASHSVQLVELAGGLGQLVSRFKT
ncbi:methyl-accepting chemotaxis protein [Pseudogulbenkiania ferrooxidans]|uniref:Methyl-accepting chemotaxis sensory transducer with Cache sensor n=1 Tax=Pseudogulbenkiania ferrooxidans 2002 TaxID=279714 RepID=B9Z825_9NEIS|nr:methyl-accepting chemotaxis protein [Pseudogulbenkiania ferrooxidans]EEG07080.1 methyl-accepting chemotaxis sensory transducer with Cache sensor [Pseudogulbenkiania ferrooxidans 2002]